MEKICEYMKLVLRKGRTLGAVSQSVQGVSLEVLVCSRKILYIILFRLYIKK